MTKLLIKVNGSKEQACDCVIAASWSSTTAVAAVAVATDCNSGKCSDAVSSHGTVAPLPSIGITPSSPDVAKTPVAGPGVQPQQSSMLQDPRAETTDLKNDTQVSLPADH